MCCARFIASFRCCLPIATVFPILFGTPPAHAQAITEQKKSVAFAFGIVHMPDASKNLTTIYAPLGTVFFVYYPETRDGKDYGFVYVVTAKHVLKDLDGTYLKEITIRLNLKTPTPERGYEDVTGIPVADPQDNKNLTWFHDANEAVDVAAVPFLPDQKSVDFKAIPLSMFVDDTILRGDGVAEGDPAYFIGLMAQYYGRNRNYPVVRRGTLALMTDENIDTPTGRQRAFIAELLSWPGNSGSPVFLNLGGLRGNTLSFGEKLKFLGILSGGFNNVIEGSVLNTPTVHWGSGLPIGISYIVPADRVKVVLDSPAAQQNRDTQIHSNPNPQ